MFALHPIHTEAVTGVVGRAELLSACFFMAAIIFYSLATQLDDWKRHFFLLVAAISIPLAALSKETGITVAGLLVIYEMAVVAKWDPQRPFSTLTNLAYFSNILRLATIFGTTIGFLYVRLKVMPQMPHFSM